MKHSSKRLQILLAVALLLYACGYLTQFIGNYAVWQKNGGMPGGTSPAFPSLSPPDCFKGILWFPYNLYCMAGCAATFAAIFLYRKLFSQDALTDSERNFDFSAKGTYGTSGWMQPREIPAVLDMVSDLSKHAGTVLGMLDGKFLCIPEKTRMNGNLAVYGASGSMKTRSFCMNRMPNAANSTESMVVRQMKLLGNMLGAEIDFVILGIDSKTRSVVASRREAMMRKRQLFYFSPDANGEYRVREGRVVQARVIAVADKSMRWRCKSPAYRLPQLLLA